MTSVREGEGEIERLINSLSAKSIRIFEHIKI